MTDDEILTRLYRCEARQKAMEVLLLCVLPALEPTRRPLVLEQFGQFRQKWEARLQDPSADSEHLEMEVKELAELYAATEGTLATIAAYEDRKLKKSTFFTR
jgi:hypothetical protein